MTDIECPYCDADMEVCQDDGHGCTEDQVYEEQCSECDKYFTFTMSWHPSFSPAKADCLNGDEHKYEATHTWPKRFTKMRCVDCDDTRECTDEEMDAVVDEQ